MSELNLEEIDKMWDDVENNCLKLKIVMGGKTGVGKTSTINAVIGVEVGEVSDAKPGTKKNQELVWPTDSGDMIIIDVPGFGEANSPEINNIDYQENIRVLAKDAHLFVLVLKCDDRALELEEKFLKKWQSDSDLKKIPTLIVINQIDKAKPARDWEPESLNLDNPIKEKDIYIKTYLDYVSSLPTFSQYSYNNNIFLVSAGEFFGDKTYGMEKLKIAINNNIPNILTLILDRNSKSKYQKTKAITNYYSMSAAAVAIQPIPWVDSFLIAPIQIAMIIHIGKIYNINITKGIAGGLISSIGLSFLGNHIFLNLASMFPVIKQFVGPAIAYSLTFTTGLVVNELFSSGNLNPSKQEIKELVERFKIESKNAKEKFEEQNIKI